MPFSLCALVLAAVLPLAAGCAGKMPSPNVVVVVLDTARPDYLSVYGHPRPTSPFLERFAREATRYERAYSVSSWTLPAHASLFSGVPPAIHGATQNHLRVSADVPLLAERLAAAGYNTAGFSNNAWVSERTGLARGFARFQFDWKSPRRTGPHVDPPPPVDAHPTVLAVRKWLAQERDVTRPFFLFVNLIEPHLPYLPSWQAAEPFFEDSERWREAMQELFPDGGPQAVVNRHYTAKDPLRESEWEALRHLYEGELRATDAIVEAIIRDVDAYSDPQRTLVFLLSDHGENLGDHGHLGHVLNLYDSNLRIVFLARGPGFGRGVVEQRLVQIMDVYPTVLRAAGLEPEPSSVGIDLRGELPEDRILHAELEYPAITLSVLPAELRQSGALERYERTLSAAVSTRYKAIRGSDGSEEVYDLLVDPHEAHPLGPGAAARAGLPDLPTHDGPSPDAVPGAREASAAMRADPEMREALRALGYVE